MKKVKTTSTTAAERLGKMESVGQTGVNSQEYKDGWQRIFGKKNKSEESEESEEKS